MDMCIEIAAGVEDEVGHFPGLIEVPVTASSPECQAVLRIYEEAFPEWERLPFEQLLQATELGCCELSAYYDACGGGEADARESEPCGFTFNIVAGGYLYVLFLAVNANVRSRGYGSRILAHLRQCYAECEHVLDIEPPDDEDADNIEQRVRRLGFYQRNGFKETEWDMYEGDVRYTVLSTSGSFDAEAFGSALEAAVPGFIDCELRRR